MEEVVKLLNHYNKTISVMESCTGGGICNKITNVEGASKVFKFGAVTYANSFKIKFNVDENLIEKYSVYSMEVAKDMSKKISIFADANLGIGVTGKLNRIDEDNPYGEDNIVYVSIYDRDNDVFYTDTLTMTLEKREDNKEIIIDNITSKLLEILKSNTN